MSDNDRQKRRRNIGVGNQPGQPEPLPDLENDLTDLARRIGETDYLYAKRDEVVITMYDHGYTHKQLADLMNDAAGTTLTYDAVGRIIRAARRAGVKV